MLYLDHFGLTEAPFTLTPDTRFYCDFVLHHQAFQSMCHSIEEGQGFCLIHGEVGTGKTLLCHKLIEHLDEQKIHACLVFNPNTDLAALQLAIMNELGTRNKDIKEKDSIDVIYEKLLSNAHAGKDTVLIIDEGQGLSDEGLEFIRALTNLETRSRKLLQIIIFAQPELLHKLKKANLRQLAQRFRYTCELKPMDKAQMSLYIAERLISAGHSHGQVVQKGALKTLWLYSNGNPRLINTLMHKALLSAYASQRQIVNKKDIIRAAEESQLACSSLSHSHIQRSYFKPVTAIITTFILVLVLGYVFLHDKGVL